MDRKSLRNVNEKKLQNLPSDWGIKRTKEILYIKGRIGWKGLKKSEFTESGPYLITGVDFDKGKIDWDNCFHITPERYEESPEIMVQKGDVLITKDGTIGKVAYIDYLPYKSSLNSHLLLLRPITNDLYSKYLFYALQGEHFRSYIDMVKSGSTLAGLSQSNFEKYVFPLPPLREQQKIAAILTSVDEAIEKTEAIIEQTEKVKKGVMQQLLTKGIGHTKFKKTEIGDIPEEWNLLRLKDIISSTKLGTNDTANSDEGIPLIKMGNLDFGSFKLSKVEYIGDSIDEYKQFILKDGDFLFNTRNTPELVGKSAVWHDQLEMAIYNNNIMRINFKDSISSPDFICHQFNNGLLKSKIRGLVNGTTSVAAIYWKDLSKLLVPVPTSLEQLKISRIIASIDKKIDLNSRRIIQLQNIKSGLMQVLLTGKVRVKVEEEVEVPS